MSDQPRKKYKSDKTTTTLRILKTVHTAVRKAAKADGRNMFEFTNRTLSDALAQPKKI